MLQDTRRPTDIKYIFKTSKNYNKFSTLQFSKNIDPGKIRYHHDMQIDIVMIVKFQKAQEVKMVIVNHDNDNLVFNV